VQDDYLILNIADWDLNTVQQLYMKNFKFTNETKDMLGKLSSSFSFSGNAVFEHEEGRS
jgi:hypothetical protein